MGVIKEYLKIFYRKNSFLTKKLHFSNVFKTVTSSLILLIFFSNQILFTACEDEVIQPSPKPPGYQEDIPWPSLADSPWPMNHHDPQSTGRNNETGPITGNILWEYNSDREFRSGIVISQDLYIFITSSSDSGSVLLKFSMDGIIVSERLIPADFPFKNFCTPLITNSGKIICSNGRESIYCFNSDLTIDWVFKSDELTYNESISVDKEGNLYFTKTFYGMQVLSPEGILLGEITDNRINLYPNTSSISFSPDGNTAYLPGRDVSVVAVDISNLSIKWTFGEITTGNTVVVDSQGNIYVIQATSPFDSKLISITPNGSDRWSYPFAGVSNNAIPCIDREGNIYFGNDSLHCLDFEGNLKWIIELEDINSPLVCDKENNIFVITGTSSNLLFTCHKISPNGEIIWSKLLDSGSTYSSPAIFNGKLLINSLTGELIALQ